MTAVDSNYGLQVDKPVRCGDGPAGERAYLDRLRCPGGKNVKYRRRGSMLSPASTKPVDAYDVECNCGQHQIVVYMDMYAKTPAVPVGSSGWTLTG